MRRIYREIKAKETWVDINTSGMWKHIIVEATSEVPDGYELVTSIIDIDEIHFYDTEILYYINGAYYATDYKLIRDIIKEYVEETGVSLVISTESDPSILTPSEGDTHLIGDNPIGIWSGMQGSIAKWESNDWKYFSKSESGFDIMSGPEKIVCCKNKIGSREQRTDTVTFEGVMLFMSKYAAACNISRKYRMECMTIDIWNRLGEEASEQLISDAGAAISAYVSFGRDGSHKGDLWGISDYIMGTVGSPFEANGLINKQWEVIGFPSISSYAGYCYSILLDGKYIIK